MAQSIITGLTGVITLPDDADGNPLTQYVSSISLNTGAELLDVSSYGGAGYRKRVAGLKDLSGSAVCFMSKGATGTNPFNLDANAATGTETPTMTILFDTGCSISFTAIIGSVSIVGEYQGLNIVTFNFSNAADAAPTVVWDTGA